MEPFVWIDLETTDLEPESEQILEVGLIVTDQEYNPLDVFTSLVEPKLDPETLRRFVSPFVREMHDKSGLWDQLGTIPPFSARPAQVESKAIQWLERIMAEHEFTKPPLCGSSVGFDRGFLKVHMPTLEGYFHYRNIDVSTIKELCRRRKPEVLESLPAKAERHRAYPDLLDTIGEMKHYDKYLFTEAVA